MTIENIYKKEEIFTNVDKEKGTVDMIIPEEVKVKMGWKPGDMLWRHRCAGYDAQSDFAVTWGTIGC